LLLYVVEFDPTGLKFRYHWYIGDVPGWVAVTVNITLVPLQMLLLEATIAKSGTSSGLIVIGTCGDSVLQVVEPFSVTTTEYNPVVVTS
jgi:hypothetical protein